jgi:small ligand-binding sensory domain FIST
MSLFTSSQFASAAASGTDWRDTAKTVLEKLEDVRSEDRAFNVGFLYVSDALVDDAESILNLFKSVLKIEHWIGGVGVGVCGCGEGFVDQPAISAMVGCFDDEDFSLFASENGDIAPVRAALTPWLKKHEPLLVVGHGDPLADHDLTQTIQKVGDFTGGFLVGGLTSSRSDQQQFAGDICRGGISGAVFSSGVKVATTLSQGCHKIGETHTVSRSDGQTVIELDGRKAVDVFEDDLRTMAIKKIDVDPDEIMVDPDNVPEEFSALFKGEVHAALAVSESDQNDYMVRHIVGLDQDEGSMTVGEMISNGDRMMFVRRDADSVYQDLSKSLLALRERVIRDEGEFSPKGALYISCVARAADEMGEERFSEMELVREIIGDVPLAGFYAGGEINNARLYGYTGVLTLFL